MKTRTSVLDELAETLFTVSRIMRERVLRKNKIYPGSFLQFGALKYIQMRGRVRMKELSELLRITPGTLTALIGRLSRQGFVESTTGINDRRHLYLKTTKKGERLLKNHLEKVRKEIQAVMLHLSEKSQKQLLKILQELIYKYQKKK